MIKCDQLFVSRNTHCVSVEMDCVADYDEAVGRLVNFRLLYLRLGKSRARDGCGWRRNSSFGEPWAKPMSRSGRL